jgi:transcriptional regulator with XRE-family HTH domain
VGRRDTQSAFYRKIIDALIQHRRDAEITQWELARRMGTDQSQISKLERGERRLDIADYARYCHAIGLDPGLLLKEVD